MYCGYEIIVARDSESLLHESAVCQTISTYTQLETVFGG